MTFQELENQFWQLKGKQATGILSETDFLSEVSKLRKQDEQNQWWTVNSKDGTWLTYVDQQWVKGVPPAENLTDMIPPPPPPPAPPPSAPPRKEPTPHKESPPNLKRKPKPRPSGPTIHPKIEEVPIPPVKEKVPTPPIKEPVPTPPIKETIPTPPKQPPAPPKKTKTGFCPECGSTIGPGDKFCGDCGHRFQHTKAQHDERVNPNSHTNKPKYVKRTWAIGALIYTILIYGLISFLAFDISTLIGPYSLYFYDAFLALLLFAIVLRKNKFKLKVTPGRTPGKDVIFILILSLAFVIITQLVGPYISGYGGGVFASLFNISLESDLILIIYVVLNYIIYVLAGIGISLLGLKLAPSILKDSKNR